MDDVQVDDIEDDEELPEIFFIDLFPGTEEEEIELTGNDGETFTWKPIWSSSTEETSSNDWEDLFDWNTIDPEPEPERVNPRSRTSSRSGETTQVEYLDEDDLFWS